MIVLLAIPYVQEIEGIEKYKFPRGKRKLSWNGKAICSRDEMTWILLWLLHIARNRRKVFKEEDICYLASGTMISRLHPLLILYNNERALMIMKEPSIWNKNDNSDDNNDNNDNTTAFANDKNNSNRITMKMNIKLQNWWIEYQPISGDY